MNACFVDTYFFLALLNRKDPRHLEAVRANRIIRPMITTSWILLELADHLCDIQNRRLFKEVRSAITVDPRFTLLPTDQMQLDQAMQFYDQRPDKEWLLTDCTSFIVMRRHGIHDALTADHHFEQAGFNLLLK